MCNFFVHNAIFQFKNSRKNGNIKIVKLEDLVYS